MTSFRRWEVLTENFKKRFDFRQLIRTAAEVNRFCLAEFDSPRPIDDSRLTKIHMIEVNKPIPGDHSLEQFKLTRSHKIWHHYWDLDENHVPQSETISLKQKSSSNGKFLLETKIFERNHDL